MKALVRPLTCFLVFTVVAICGGVFVVTAIRRPVPEPVATYSAAFTDVAGLRVGDDVRLLGVPVGKVDSISLHQRGDASTAQVTFTLATTQQLYPGTRLGIRYLNLTGIRYVDVQQPTAPGRPLKRGTRLPLDQTSPSFDITRVFRGLAPVLVAMQPADLNHLFASVLALVQGDTTGLDGTLQALTKALRFVDDRKAVVDTIVSNLASVASTIDGKSQYLQPIISYFEKLATTLSNDQEQLRSYADSTGDLVMAADHLLDSVGLEPNQTPDLDNLVRQVIPTTRSAIGVLSMTPAIITALDKLFPATTSASLTRHCSRGVAQLPPDVAVFIDHTQVTVCNR